MLRSAHNSRPLLDLKLKFYIRFYTFSHIYIQEGD
jgi:hypothetical protein